MTDAAAPETERPAQRDDPDAGLAARAASGDRQAFAVLLERHYDRMHRIAWRMTGSYHDAQDVVQDVCCSLPQRVQGFHGRALFTTWLTGVVRNACIDAMRRSSTQARMRARLAVVGEDGSLRASDPHARIWIESGIAMLPTELREAVVLVAGEGMSHKEASVALGCAESTVSWRIHEARKRLREQGLEEALDV